MQKVPEVTKVIPEAPIAPSITADVLVILWAVKLRIYLIALPRDYRLFLLLTVL